MTILEPKAPMTLPTTEDQRPSAEGAPAPRRGRRKATTRRSVDAHLTREYPPLLPSDEAPADQPRRWVRHILGGGQLTEVCPAWCNGSHTQDQVGMVDDLSHDSGTDVELTVDVVDHWENGQPGTSPLPILRASLRVDPYSDKSARRVPFVVFEPSMDDVMDELDPDGFATVIAQIRAHCDRLDQVHAQLVQARADWQNGGTR